MTTRRSVGRLRSSAAGRAIIRSVVRALVSTTANVVIAVLVGVVASFVVAVLRGGSFGHELGSSLWIVGALMLLVALFSFSPSTRRAQDELLTVAVGSRFRARHHDEGGAGFGLSVILVLAAACMFGLALIYG
jgi:hypothetical protein